MIIGVSGYARVGKDETASVLVRHLGYERRAFADPLKEALYRLDPLIGFNTRLAPTVDQYGWDHAKTQYVECRELLQRFGTEVGRAMFGANFWVDLATRDLQASDQVIFSDVRFPSEAEAVKRLGGEVWRIERLGHGPANGHASETALDEWKFDRTIRNYGTLQDLEDMVLTLMRIPV